MTPIKNRSGNQPKTKHNKPQHNTTNETNKRKKVKSPQEAEEEQDPVQSGREDDEGGKLTEQESQPEYRHADHLADVQWPNKRRP